MTGPRKTDVCQALRNNRSLQNLLLRTNQITDVGREIWDLRIMGIFVCLFFFFFFSGGGGGVVGGGGFGICRDLVCVGGEFGLEFRVSAEVDVQKPSFTYQDLHIKTTKDQQAAAERKPSKPIDPKL